jgi:Tol biopolymer transport system component
MNSGLVVSVLAALAGGCSSTPAQAKAAPVVLAAETTEGVVLLDPATGSQLRLVVAGGHSPAVSPDGRRIAFMLADGAARHVWVSDLDGSRRRQLTRGPFYDTTPDWSPDGTRLALCRAAALQPFGVTQLALVDVSDGRAQIVPGTVTGCSPSWSPDSKRVVYHARDGIRITDIVGDRNELLSPDGSNPDWSPDGRTVAAVDVTTSESNITLIDVMTRQRRTITEFAGYHMTWMEPAWSPDGTSLYTSAATEGFPDENGNTDTGYGLEHRAVSGLGGADFWVDGPQGPALGGGS